MSESEFKILLMDILLQEGLDTEDVLNYGIKKFREHEKKEIVSTGDKGYARVDKEYPIRTIDKRNDEVQREILPPVLNTSERVFDDPERIGEE